MPTPQKVTINCAAWGARQLFDESRNWRALADEATAAGDDARAATCLRNAENCRIAGRNALLAEGLPDDEGIEPETWTDLTPEDIHQREKDAIEGERIAWAMLRTHRDALLKASDWTQMPGARIDAATRQAWDDYRQALFDLPATTTNPNDPQWPAAPS